MQFLDVPPEFQQPQPLPHPGHSRVGLEAGVHQELRRVAGVNPPLPWTYIPIHWFASTQRQSRRLKIPEFKLVPEIQNFLDSTLKPGLNYFTVSQCDDGIYERLPPNVLNFNAGGEGDIPIPLLCDPHPKTQVNSSLLRTNLASFVGNFACGGPILTGKHREQSSWDPQGIGARTREAMRLTFRGKPGVEMRQQDHGNQRACDDFRFSLQRCQFALAPRGYGRTSFRMYEAIEFGAIPVYIYTEPWLPFADVLNWNTFAMLCHVDELPKLETRLRSIQPRQQERMRETGRRIFNSFFTYAGVAENIYRILRQKTAAQ